MYIGYDLIVEHHLEIIFIIRNSEALIGLAMMVYEPLYHALQIWQLYASAQNEKHAENRLFLHIKARRILDILWAFIIKQLFHSRLLDMR